MVKTDFGNQHCEFNEEIDSTFPEPLMEETAMTIFVDSNHSHGEATGKSTIGLVSSLGSAPENWFAKS